MKIFKIFILQIVIGIIAMAYSGQSDWSTMAVYYNKIPENIAVN